MTFLSFITVLLIAEALFLFSRPKRKYFFARVVIGFIVLNVCAYVMPKIIIFSWLDLSFAVIFILTMVYYWFCFKIPLMDVVFLCVGGYAVQNATHNIFQIVKTIFKLSELAALYSLSYIIVFSVCYVLFYFLFARRVVENSYRHIRKTEIVILSTFIIALVYVFSMYVSVYSDPNWSNLIERVYALVCAMLTLFIQSSFFEKSEIMQEKETIEQLLMQKESQHDMAKAIIDQINIKCHDLKRSIASMRLIKNDEERENMIGELENSTLIYDSIIKTGNDALDIILTEKSLYCSNCSIKLSYIVDGGSLSFVRPADIYTLFSNALDNAIEAVEQEKDVEKKIISLNISSHGNLVYISLENYCKDNLSFTEDGLPITTKDDKAVHGYGIKSMRFIVKKYNGNLVVTQKDNRFTLNIMLPCGETSMITDI